VRGNTREAERFAAAAIAFAWQYDDPKFKKHFQRKICGFVGDPPLRKAEIFVEPERWADLLVVNRDGNQTFVYAVECKIGARLEKHQNPTRRAFGQVRGYGRLLTESFSRQGTKFRFVVLGFPLKLPDKYPWKLPVPVKVRQCAWEDFAGDFPKTALARDLALSLGKLDVGAFPASETKTMKVHTKRSDIGNGVRTIAEVQRRLGGRGCKATFYQQETAWYFGLDLKKVPKSADSANSAVLTKLAKPPEGWLALICYQGEDDDERAELAVWIYCGGDDRQKQVARLLRRNLKNFLKDFHIDTPDRDKKYFNVRVTARTHRQPSDVEWFCSVLKALGLSLKN
jgi:hypothetical protein